MSFFNNSTVTLYNAWESDTSLGTYYYPTIFNNVELQNAHGANVIKTGLESANTALLVIDVDRFTKPYADPYIWQEMDEESRKTSFTATPYKNDFFVAGEYTEILTSRKLPNFFNENYQLFTVSNVDYYIKEGHIEIGGK